MSQRLQAPSDGTQTKRSRQSNTQNQMNTEQSKAMQVSPSAVYIPTQSSSTNLPPQNDSQIEKYVMDMNLQMHQMVAQNEMRNQQSEGIMKFQQQRILELQNMCESMKSELDQVRDGKNQQFTNYNQLEEGLSHLDMLNDFESISKANPYSYQPQFMNNRKANKYQGDDSLNQFMQQFNSGFTPMNNNPRQIPPSQSSRQMRNPYQEPRLNSRQNNQFQSAASLTLNSQQFQQQGQPGQYQDNMNHQQNQYQGPQYGQNDNQNYKENKFNPIIQRIEQQNDMLMKLISEMDKPKSSKISKKNKKRQADSSDSSDNSGDETEEAPINQEALLEQKFLEKKIAQLENSIKQQKMQNQYMIDNNISNPDFQFLMEAANSRNNSMNNQNPQQAFGNSIYNKQQYGASQMPAAQMSNNPKFNNLPSPDEFLSQVQNNQFKFKSHLPPQMNAPQGIGGGGGMSGLARPQFLNDNAQVPHPDMLQQIFQQQLLNSRKN